MHGETFVLLIVLIVIGVPVFLAMTAEVAKRWIGLKERQLEQTAHLAAEKAATDAMHIDKLERRVRVLERIATDRGVHLAEEIDSLDADTLN